ncbi:MAG: WG repeat-containing protein [Deltaproteobacteria bacterium]|nr:WG repeat-containing protein [Deltaproteobacteria bacterium]
MLKNIIIILFVLLSTTVQAADCRYRPKPSKGNPHPELSPQGKCGEIIGQDEFRIDPKHLKNLSFKSDLAEVFVGDKVFYVSKSGKAARTHLFDGGADYFEEGLARTISSGKFGYMDEKLAVVIKPEYDFAFPFENGVAVVCNGCRPVSEGEHHLLTGGKWGAIDRSGAVVIPLTFSREELRESVEYKTLKKKKERGKSIK